VPTCSHIPTISPTGARIEWCTCANVVRTNTGTGTGTHTHAHTHTHIGTRTKWCCNPSQTPPPALVASTAAIKQIHTHPRAHVRTRTEGCCSRSQSPPPALVASTAAIKHIHTHTHTHTHTHRRVLQLLTISTTSSGCLLSISNRACCMGLSWVATLLKGPKGCVVAYLSR